MDAAHRKPCTTRRGKQKERWPNEQAAWFVAELVALGMRRVGGRKKQLYAYRCPHCAGWHLASCRTAQDRRVHEAGLVNLRAERIHKNTENATKKGH